MGPLLRPPERSAGAAHPLIEYLRHGQIELGARLMTFNRLIDSGETLETIAREAQRLLASQALYISLRTDILFPPLERALGQELPLVDSLLDMWRSQTALLEHVADRAAVEDRVWSARRGKALIGQARDLMWKEATILFLVLERAFSHRSQGELVETMVSHVTRDASLRVRARPTPAESAIR